MAALAMFAIALLYQFGRLGVAQRQAQRFVEALALGQADGVTLEDALATPVGVRSVDGTILIDNSLRVEYELAVSAYQGLTPGVEMLRGAAVLILAFMPIVVYAAAVHVGARDRRTGVLKVRVARLGRGRYLTALAIAASTQACVVVAAGLLGVAAGSAFRTRLDESSIPQVVRSAAAATPSATDLWIPAAAVLALAGLGVAASFVALGTGDMLVGTIALVLTWTVVPIASGWDPRNAWGHLLEPVLARVPETGLRSAVQTPWWFDAAVLLGTGAVLAGIGALTFVRRSAYSVRGSD